MWPGKRETEMPYGIGRIPRDVDPVSEQAAEVEAASKSPPRAQVVSCPQLWQANPSLLPDERLAWDGMPGLLRRYE